MDKHTHNKYLIVSIFSAICLILVAFTFWKQDVRYSLPTPKPPRLQQKSLGAVVNFSELQSVQKPMLLHFFNPECPCSKFNVEHLRELVTAYQDSVQFVAVIQTEDSADAVRSFKDLELPIPYIVDANGRIADSCGIYSTPQALILDSSKKIYYRGNYNVSRYCTSPQTAFAHLALQALLQHEPLPPLSTQATTAYGCELPSNQSTKSAFPLPKM
jgi:hypothetical protein